MQENNFKMKNRFIKELGLIGILSVGFIGCPKTETKPEKEPASVKQNIYYFDKFGEINFPSDFISAIAVGDFDGDGDIDIVFGTRSYKHRVIIYENKIPQKNKDYLKKDK